MSVPTLEKARNHLRYTILRQTAATVGPRDAWYTVISGEAHTGKTTTASWLGREHEKHARETSGRGDDPSFVPVVYIECPEAMTQKSLMMRFHSFLGYPPRWRSTTEELTNRVVRLLIDAGTSLVIIDDIHNVEARSTTGRNSANHLTAFSRRVPAGFLYAGIRLDQDNLFAGVAGAQTRGRSRMLALTDYARTDPIWPRIITAMESRLPLLNHTPRSLSTLSDYLWDRTGGNVSTLAELLRAASLTAIANGTEELTVDLLDDTDVDVQADAAARARDNKPRANKTKTTNRPSKRVTGGR